MTSNPNTSTNARIAIIGGGPSGLIAAEHLAQAGHSVDVFERMPTLGRKFLMAGRGGLNLTHSEPLEALLARYQPSSPVLGDAIRAFPPDALREWAEGLGQETFAGTSGRVFPKAMKASPLLRAWLGRLAELRVQFHLRHEFLGWNNDGALRFARYFVIVSRVHQSANARVDQSCRKLRLRCIARVKARLGALRQRGTSVVLTLEIQ